MTDTRPFDPAVFHDAAINPETASLNAQIIELFAGQPEWWIVGAQASREARLRGEGPFPAPVFSDRARTITIPGKDHSLAVERGQMNAPRVLQEVEGDFIVQVKVSADFPKQTKSVVEGRRPFHSALSGSCRRKLTLLGPGWLVVT